MSALLAIGRERFTQVGDRLVVDGTELVEECRNIVGRHAQARFGLNAPCRQDFCVT